MYLQVSKNAASYASPERLGICKRFYNFLQWLSGQSGLEAETQIPFRGLRSGADLALLYVPKPIKLTPNYSKASARSRPKAQNSLAAQARRPRIASLLLLELLPPNSASCGRAENLARRPAYLKSQALFGPRRPWPKFVRRCASAPKDDRARPELLACQETAGQGNEQTSLQVRSPRRHLRRTRALVCFDFVLFFCWCWCCFQRAEGGQAEAG